MPAVAAGAGRHARLRRNPASYLTAIGEPCDPVPPRIGDGE